MNLIHTILNILLVITGLDAAQITSFLSTIIGSAAAAKFAGIIGFLKLVLSYINVGSLDGMIKANKPTGSKAT